MPPAKVICQNCESEEISACEVGEDTIYRCSGASESEIESRSGCGVWITFKEFKVRRDEAMKNLNIKPSAATNNSIKSSTPAAPIRNGLTSTSGTKLPPMRRPLASLHSNTLHNRTPLHSKPAVPAPAPSLTPSQPISSSPHTPSIKSTMVDTPTNTSSAPSASSKPVASKVAATPAVTKSNSNDSGDDSEDDGSDDEDGGDDDEVKSTTSATAASKPHAPSKPAPKAGRKKVTSTSSTPTKLPSSAASSPIKANEGTVTFNLADPSVSAHDRMRALRLKLAKQREKSLLEFKEKYGAEGDEETEEERQHAQRKQSGKAGEEFMSSQGDVQVTRAPMIGSLSIKGAENPLAGGHRRPFAQPRAHGSMTTEAKSLIAERQKYQGRRLGARLRIFSGQFGAFKALAEEAIEEVGEVAPPPPPVVLTKEQETKAAPDGFQPLMIWQPTPDELAANPKLTTIEVPMIVCKWLRPHQREGVKFMCECVLGQRNLGPSGSTDAPPTTKTITNADGTTSVVPAAPSPINEGGGAILADDMGLGKTLQSVALLYTLLTQGFEQSSPVARKVIIVTPTSLVSNWNNEIEKWLGKGKVNTVALSEVGKDNISCGIDSFVGRGSKMHVLIVSYDTFRRNVERLNKPGFCDLLICDEAHRLKNNKTSTYVALDSLPCKRRVLLSGTPMQNDLSEFFSMINFTNRNILGDRRCFRKYYELPILLGREPDCLERDAEEGSERASELSAIVNQFVLRRTNVLLRQHLPPKVIQVVCCRPSELQVKLYRHFLSSKSVKKLTRGDDDEGGGRASGGLQALPLITSLKKLCNHPKLIWDTAQGADTKKRGTVLNEETGLVEKIPPALLSLFKGLTPIFQSYDGGSFLRNPSAPQYSGKMFVLERLLTQIRVSNSGDRIVIVSNFTSALDVIAMMCQTKKWDFLRLDGTTSIKNRQKLVDQLSDHRGNKVFVFLLSSRAGGCGLNLIGANRLILFDPDWNPAVDKQAAARVWRDGQTKRCFVYRFLTTGSIEEKVYQRQLSKEGLSGVLGGSTADASLTKDELRDLFTLDDSMIEQPSDTHKSLECDCLDQFQIQTEAEATKAEEMAKKEAEDHLKRLEAEEAKAKEEAETAMDETGEDKKDSSSDSSNSPVAQIEGGDDSNKMDDIEPGAPVGEPDEETGEGEVEGEPPAAESSSDEEMNDFIASDGDDDGEEDYGSKKKGGPKAKKPSKKDGPRKQRKKRATVGSLNFPMLHALTSCTLGQRGEPPEEELINWAHHATSNSIPDPIFRVAAKNMPFTRGSLPFVSFVFSCEVTGKAILNSSDATDAERVSSKCEMAPTTVQASKPVTVTLETALAKHAEFMRHENAKSKKRLGTDEFTAEERLADPSKRRHSSRLKPTNNSDGPDPNEPDQDDLDFIAPDDDEDEHMEGSGEGQTKGEGATKPTKPPAESRKRKGPVDDGMDEATRLLIEQMQAEDAGLVRKKKSGTGGGRGRKKKAIVDEDAMEDITEGEESKEDTTTVNGPSPTDDASSVEAISPPKKRKTEVGAVIDQPEHKSEHNPRSNNAAASPSKRNSTTINMADEIRSPTPKTNKAKPSMALTKKTPVVASANLDAMDDDEDDFVQSDGDDEAKKSGHQSDSDGSVVLDETRTKVTPKPHVKPTLKPAIKPATKSLQSQSTQSISSLTKLKSPNKLISKPTPQPIPINQDDEDDFLD